MGKGDALIIDSSQVQVVETTYGAWMVHGVIEGSPLSTFGYTREAALSKWGELVQIWHDVGQRMKTAEKGNSNRV